MEEKCGQLLHISSWARVIAFVQKLSYNKQKEMVKIEKYIANVITQEDLDSIQPGQFNVLCAPCGSGKTTFMFDDRILKFARAKKHVLYLIHNM